MKHNTHKTSALLVAALLWGAGASPAATTPRAVNDFDGDGRSDLGQYKDYYGAWMLQLSHGGLWRTSDVKNVSFGFDGTRLLEGDFDGDRVADYALYEASTFRWYLGQSQAGYSTFGLGYSGATPVTGDFDGDGRTDVGCYEPARGNWSLRRSSAGPTNFVLGFPGSMLAVADFDGDGRDDAGVFRPDDGLWRVNLSSGGTLQTNFGGMVDVGNGFWDRPLPQPADYDGDGRADLAVFHSTLTTNNFKVLQSSAGRKDGTVGINHTHFGDFDGDGRMDVASLVTLAWPLVLTCQNPNRASFPLTSPLFQDAYARDIGAPEPVLERQFSWISDLHVTSGVFFPVTYIGKTGLGRTFRVKLPAAGKSATGTFIDAKGVSAPAYLSGMDGASFFDSPGTANTGPITLLAPVRKQSSFPLGPWGTPLGFYFIDTVLFEGIYRDNQGETSVTLTRTALVFATF